MLLKEHEELLKNICIELNNLGYQCNVSSKELIIYLSQRTYTKELIELDQILSNKYLLLHELVEITLLKNRGYNIVDNILVKAYPDTYEAHLEAIDIELQVAWRNHDIDWIKKRLRDLESYLRDPLLPKELEPKVKELIHKYSVLVMEK